MRFTVIAPALTGLLIGVVAPVPAQQPVGEFYFFERSDRSTGEDRSSITTVAEEGYVSGAGGLTVHCADEGLELVVSASYLGRDMSIPVSYAFGDEEPRAASWSLRRTGMAAVAPRDVMLGFLDRAVLESSVVFGLSDFQMRRHTYTFHLAGLDSALSLLSCR
jgi:hypothetical protein